MRGIAGKKGNITEIEDAVKLLSNSLFIWNSPVVKGLLGLLVMNDQPGLSHQQVLGRHTDASGMVCMCLSRNQFLSCVLADTSQGAELTVGQEGHVSPSSWK